jgi:hypothetical protein
MVCVRPSDDVLGAFSVTKPTTEIFAGKTGPDSRIRKTGFGKWDSEKHDSEKKNGIRKTGFRKQDSENLHRKICGPFVRLSCRAGDK